MAYVSNTINNAYKVRRDNQSPTDAGGGSVQKNVGSTSLGGGGVGTSNTAEKAPGEFTQAKSLQGATNAALTRNQGAGEGVQNTLMQPGQRQATAANNGLAQETDAYKQQAADAYKPPDYSKDYLNDLGSNFSKVQGALDYQAPQLGSFETKQQTAITNPTALQPGNYGSLLQKEKGQSYTAGQGALDDALFSRSPDRQANLQQGYNQIQQGVDTNLNNAKALQGQLQGDYDTKLSGLKDTIRGDIGSAQSSALSGAQAKQSALQQQEAARLADEKSKLVNNFDPTNALLQRNVPTQLQGQVLQQLKGLDMNQFVNSPEANVDLSNVLSPEEAQRMNQLSQLQGNAGNYQSAGYTPGHASLNNDAYNAAIQKIIDQVSNDNARKTTPNPAPISGTVGKVNPAKKPAGLSYKGVHA